MPFNFFEVIISPSKIYLLNCYELIHISYENGIMTKSVIIRLSLMVRGYNVYFKSSIAIKSEFKLPMSNWSPH